MFRMVFDQLLLVGLSQFLQDAENMIEAARVEMRRHRSVRVCLPDARYSFVVFTKPVFVRPDLVGETHWSLPHWFSAAL